MYSSIELLHILYLNVYVFLKKIIGNIYLERRKWSERSWSKWVIWKMSSTVKLRCQEEFYVRWCHSKLASEMDICLIAFKGFGYKSCLYIHLYIVILYHTSCSQSLDLNYLPILLFSYISYTFATSALLE